MSIEINKDIKSAADAASDGLFPNKSRIKYEEAYSNFCNWRLQKNPEGVRI